MQIRALRIENFRGMSRFEMKNLGRINLIVGTNNSGKTTILEAISILMPYGNATAIWSALSRRGEVLWDNRDWQADVKRLFFGHQIEIGSSFLLSTLVGDNAVGLIVEVRDDELEQAGPPSSPPPPPIDPLEPLISPRTLALTWSSRKPSQQCATTISISRRGGITYDTILRASRIYPGFDFPLRWVSGATMTTESIASLFEEIVLTPEEDMVVETLRIIEPAIERIAPARSDRSSSGSAYSPRSSVFVRLEGLKDRIPIGSMGDGIWRMLGLALNLAHSRDGILLIDEIDTGLHYTVMQGMWKFLYSAAKRYNVQVFATTHSRDCDIEVR
jgi:ABC-type branched-subunit amino acid transport system ATPase component